MLFIQKFTCCPLPLKDEFAWCPLLLIIITQFFIILMFSTLILTLVLKHACSTLMFITYSKSYKDSNLSSVYVTAKLRCACASLVSAKCFRSSLSQVSVRLLYWQIFNHPTFFPCFLRSTEQVGVVHFLYFNRFSTGLVFSVQVRLYQEFICFPRNMALLDSCIIQKVCLRL